MAPSVYIYKSKYVISWYLERVVSYRYIGHVHPLAVNVVKIRIHATDGDALITIVCACVNLHKIRFVISFTSTEIIQNSQK